MKSLLSPFLIGIGLVFGLWTGMARGQEEAPAAAGPTEHNRCRPPYEIHVARWANPSDTPAYEGGYVGGGCLCFGEPRTLIEGTWGWDYIGYHFARHVFIDWCHCQRPKGEGAGTYRTDGPNFLEEFHKAKEE